jgi:chemotaxis protein methyltransferase CheR
MSALARRLPAPEDAPDAFRSDERLTAANFKRLAQFVQAYSGIKMPPTKKTMLEGRIRKRVRARGRRDVNDYCRFLFDEDGFESELIHLIDAVTTNKTEFFREPSHFDVLARKILPKFADEGRRTIRAWSAAASMGAEAYTLAMVLEDFCAEHGGMDYSILGTDLCTQVLAQAVRGVYPTSMIQPVPAAMRQRYVLTSRNPANREVRIAPQLRARAAFGRLNLMDEQYPVPGDMDLIFCRNILIYFDKPTQAAVLRRLCSHLRPGGWLFLGHSESLLGVDLPVTAVASTVFRRA